MTLKNPHQDAGEIFWDCYPWLTEIREKGHVFVVGTYRLAQQLNAHYVPAILTRVDEDTYHAERVLLSAFLGKPIQLLRPGQPRFQNARAWISLGVDHTCPFLPEKGPQYIAILHDMMSYQGIFGPEAKDRFVWGIRRNRVLLYVSNRTLGDYRSYSVWNGHEDRKLIPFPNCHRFDERPWYKPVPPGVNRDSCLSLSSVFVHKNILRAAEISTTYLLRHFHLGEFYSAEQPAWNEALQRHMLTWFSDVDDELAVGWMKSCENFLCCSLSEGFSMPPMEAILCGAKRVILSDIPIHREIYGRYNVNFVSPKLGDMSFPSFHELKTITEADREHLFTTRTPENMLAGLFKHFHENP